MKSIGTLSTVHPNERAPRADRRELAKCAGCGWRQRRSPTARYCSPCKDEIDAAAEDRKIAKLNSGRYSATKKDHLSDIQRPW